MDEWTTKKIDHYVLVNQKLGRGSYGIVYRGFLESDEKHIVAAKQIPIKEICQSLSRVQYVKREIDNLQKIDSKYVVKLHAVSRTQTNLYMFLEYCMDGDLKSYLKKKENKQLSEPEAIKCFKHLVEGFKELQKHKIIHRDIKPANILMSNGVVKIADFGFSKVIEDEEARIRSFIGSPLYMSPEVLDQKPFSSKCDVWSLGIVFYEMLYGKTPWNGSSQLNLYENIRDLPLIFPDEPMRSKKVKDLIRKMLQFQEKDRISWSQIFEDDLIVGVRKNMEESLRKRDMVEGLLEKSVWENEAYIQKNLVVNYLANVEEDEDDDDKNRKKTIFEQTKKSQFQFKPVFEEDDDGFDTFEENHNDIMDERKSGGGQMQVKQLQFKSKAMSSNSMSSNASNQLVQISSSNGTAGTFHSYNSIDSQNQRQNNQIINSVHEETTEEKYIFEEKAEELIKEQINAEKMRKNILKVNEYILYERNISFFYNFVIQKLIQAHNENRLNITQDLYYRVIFIISKCQNINLIKVNAMLSSPKSDFNQQIWDCYQASLDFLKTQKLLVQDCWFAKKFNQELLKKTSQVVDDVIKRNSNAQQVNTLTHYKKVLTQSMQQDVTFKQVYQKSLSELINELKQYVKATQNKDTLIIIKYILICQNPYSIFNNSDFDFGKFYEQLENIKLEQLRKEILSQPQFKES